MSIGLVTISMWIGLSTLGAVVALFNLWDAHNDLEYQIRKADRRWQRALIARVNISNEIMRVVAHVFLFVAGVMIARGQIDPNPPPVSLYIRCVILVTIAVLVSQTMVHWWLRRRLKKPKTK